MDARQRLRADGWSLLATGDWAWVYASPIDWTVVRVCPFDPAFELFADVARSLPANRHVVRIDRSVGFAGGGFAVEMERLEPVESEAAVGFLASLLTDRDDESLSALYDSLSAAVADSTLPLLVGIDANPTNVMKRSGSDVLVLTDGLWIHGPRLMEIILTAPDDAIAMYGRHDLTHWAHLPCMNEGDTEAVLAALG